MKINGTEHDADSNLLSFFITSPLFNHLSKLMLSVLISSSGQLLNSKVRRCPLLVTDP